MNLDLWVAFVVASAVMKTFFYTYQKKLTEGFTALELSYSSTLASLPFLVPPALLVIYRNGFSYRLSTLLIIVGIGVVNIAAYWIYMEALAATDLGISSSLKRLNPALVALMEPVLLGTVFNPIIGVGCLLAGLGGYIVLLDSKDIFKPFRRFGERGVKLGFLTAVAYAVASIGSRFGASNMSPFVFGMIISVTMSIGFFFILRFRDEKVDYPGMKSLGFLGFSNGFKNLSIWIAYSMASATAVATVAQITVILNILAGGYFLKEDDTGRKLLGGFLILAGIVAVITYQ